MTARLLLLITCLLGLALGQNCQCPLESTITTTEACTCPTDDVLSVTSTSTIGACRAFRTTTVTTTSTVGLCNCPSQTTTTETAACDCPGVTATSTTVEPTVDCPWTTVTQTSTHYGSSNSTALPKTAPAAPTGIVNPTGTAPPRPTCSLDDLPSNFHLRSRPGGAYLLYDPYCGKLIACPDKADATPFHVNETDPDDLSGVPQLSLYHPSSPPSASDEYGAYVRDDGGPLRFFRAGDVPDGANEDWSIVTAGFGTYLCQLSLTAWNLHDLSTPQNCGGYLSLGYGFGEDECPEVKSTVEAA